MNSVAQGLAFSTYTASTGVCSTPGVHGLAAAIDYHAVLGTARIEAYNVRLGRYRYDALKSVPRIRVVSATRVPWRHPC
jgi:selenocysteine lyase/cysteine desulfurase